MICSAPGSVETLEKNFGESSIAPAMQETSSIEEKFGESSIAPALQVETEAEGCCDVGFGESSITTGAMDWAMDLLTEIIDNVDVDFGNRVAVDGVTSEGGNQVTFSDQDVNDPIIEPEYEVVVDEGGDEIMALSEEMTSCNDLCR